MGSKAEPKDNEFKCERCGKVFDIEDSVRLDNQLFCDPCAEREKVLQREARWKGTICTDSRGERSTYKGTFGWTLDRSILH